MSEWQIIENTPKIENRGRRHNPVRLQAMINNEIKYLGNPCKYGHRAWRYTKNGQCAECKKYKCTGLPVGNRPSPNRQKAILNHEEYYLSENPCKNGHYKRVTKSGLCKECHKIYNQTIRRPRDRGYALSRFKLTVDQYNEMLIKQNHVCLICNCPEVIIDHITKKIKLLSVDHCHETKKVRGLLCGKCNSAIGLLKHNPEILRKAALYCEFA